MSADEIEPERVWLPASESLLEWTEDFHDLLLRDQLRMDTYRQAVFESVRPGTVVVDLGTGTGILAQWALQAGAARVYGIELNEAILKEAERRLARVGLSDRFHPVLGVSTEVDLPEPADLLVSEILGNLADNEGCVTILRDARRLLAPEGRMLPQRVESYLVPVAAEKAHSQIRDGQRPGGVDAASLDAALRRRGADSRFDPYYDVVLPVGIQLAAPRLIRAYQFSPEDSDNYRVRLGFLVHKAGYFTGFKGYFVASLSEHVTLDISGDGVGHGAASESWKHCYLPIAEPVSVRPNDQITVCFERSQPVTGEVFRQRYVWQGEVVRDGTVLTRFSQRSRGHYELE
jgi:protein arginine N-methyltransferase 1